MGTRPILVLDGKKRLEFNDGLQHLDDMEREKLKDISRERNDT